MHREFLDSMVHVTRNGGSLPSCTSKVFIIGAAVVERQYASKVSWSQLLGTPLLSRLNARVSESRTLICIVLFREAALANIATNREDPPAGPPFYAYSSNQLLQTLRMHLSHPRFSQTILEAGFANSVHCAPLACPAQQLPRWRRFGRTDSPAGHCPSGARPPFFGSQCPQSAPAISIIRQSPGGPVWPAGGGRCGLERKDRPELGTVILPFVGWSSCNCV